jgi:1-acyl-sn-glycerol-3-phosphate acyltransferase
MISKVGPGFISRIEVKSYPIIGYIAQCLGSLFVDRNDKNNRGSTLVQLMEKQQRIFRDEDFSKILIFPEGTTSNATGIMPFKQGAFAAKLPIKPYILKFDPINRISLAMDVIEMVIHIFLIICKPIHFIELLILPPFAPNDYLFKESPFSKIHKVDWMIYAETVRHVMCDASGLNKIDGNYEMKKEYLDFFRSSKSN